MAESDPNTPRNIEPTPQPSGARPLDDHKFTYERRILALKRRLVREASIAMASLDAAVDALARDANLAGVALLPIHPATNRPEWRAGTPTNRFPMMGCANLIRRDCWRRYGGYCEAFFLYRNDTDLALSLLSLVSQSASMGLAFNSAWFAHHDSPTATRKSERWLHLATRNWIWMARRHGRGVWRLIGIALGTLWACKLAGLSLLRLVRVLRGVRDGVFHAAPPLAATIKPDGTAYRDLIRMQMKR